jgi:hypothetical protein
MTHSLRRMAASYNLDMKFREANTGPVRDINDFLQDHPEANSDPVPDNNDFLQGHPEGNFVPCLSWIFDRSIPDLYQAVVECKSVNHQNSKTYL